MSVVYWVIEGVGISANWVREHLDKEKLAKVLAMQLPDDEQLSKIIKNKTYDQLCVDDYLYGEPFDNFAELLTCCDDTATLSYGCDDDDDSYLYYPPSMPWERVRNEPHTLEEAKLRIVDAVQAVTNLYLGEIMAEIDDNMFIVGTG